MHNLQRMAMRCAKALNSADQGDAVAHCDRICLPRLAIAGVPTTAHRRLLARAPLRPSRTTARPGWCSPAVEHPRRTLLPPAAQSPGAVKPAVPSRRTRTCRSCHAQAQVAGQTANTSRNTRARRLWSCYLSCMISPDQGNFTGLRVQVPSDTVNPHNQPFRGRRGRDPGAGLRLCRATGFSSSPSGAGAL